jgi:hypothetical protein
MCTNSHADAERVWIELDPATEPIAGVIHRGPAAIGSFHGWVELMALIDTVREPPDDGRIGAERV